MAAKKKPVDEAEVVEETPEADLDAPLPSTPVDFGVYEAPVGVPRPDPGDVVAAAQAAEAADEDEDAE